MQASASFSDQLGLFYGNLASCIKSFHQPQLTIKHLKSVDKIARDSLTLARLHPDAFFAQLQLPKKTYPFRVNLTFNCLCLTLLLGKLHKWNESSLHQLLCAAISSFMHQQPLLEKAYQGNDKPSFSNLNQGNTRLVKLVELAKQKIWHSGLDNERAIHGLLGIKQIKNLNRLPDERQLLFVSRWISLQLTPSKRIPKQSMANVIQNLAYMLSADSYSIISPLLNYPSFVAPGSIIRAGKSRLYWVVSVTDSDIVVKGYDNDKRLNKNELEQINSSEVIKIFPPKVISDFNIINNLWSDDWKESYDDSSKVNQIMALNKRVDRAPALLLAIHDQLNKPEVDLDRVCQLVEKEQTYSQHLKLTASASSRQQLPIDNIKHAIMLHGIGRAQSIITQQALISRLTQNTFPLLPFLNQFVALARVFSEQIADCVPLFLPEEASTFMSFACASLFTDVRFKRLVLKANNNSSELRLLVTPSKNPLFLTHAKKLAVAWQQEPVSLKVINHMTNSTEKTNPKKQVIVLSTITQLSLALARLSMFDQDESDITLSNQLSATLNLDTLKFDEIKALATNSLYSYFD